MPQKWKIRNGPFASATVRVGIGSAAQLATTSGISRGTAERVMRGDAVSRETVAAIVPHLGRELDDLFEVAS